MDAPAAVIESDLQENHHTRAIVSLHTRIGLYCASSPLQPLFPSVVGTISKERFSYEMPLLWIQPFPLVSFAFLGSGSSYGHEVPRSVSTLQGAHPRFSARCPALAWLVACTQGRRPSGKINLFLSIVRLNRMQGRTSCMTSSALRPPQSGRHAALYSARKPGQFAPASKA